MDFTETEKDLLDIYEEAIGSKKVVSEDLEIVGEMIGEDHADLMGDLEKMRRKRKGNFKDMAKIKALEDNIKQNENNFELISRLLFIQERIEADKDLKVRKAPLIAPFWMNYCGEKTKIAENIRDDVAPTDRVDAICKQHDIDFDLANTPREAREADEKALKSLDELGKDKTLTSLESFNRDLVEFMLSNKKVLEDVGVIPEGSFAGIDKKLSDGDIMLVAGALTDTLAIQTDVFETINEIEGIRVNEYEFILEDLVKEKGGISKVSMNEFRDKVFDRLKTVGDLKLFKDSKFIDNFISDTYIKRQKMPPTTKSDRAKVRDEVDKLVNAGVNIEDFPEKFLKKGSITSGQLRALIMQHNKVRIVKDRLNKSKMKVGLSGGIEKMIANVKKGVLDINDGIQPNEKATTDDDYLNFLTKIDEGKDLSLEDSKAMASIEKRLGKAKILKLTATFNRRKTINSQLEKSIKKEREQEKVKEASEIEEVDPKMDKVVEKILKIPVIDKPKPKKKKPLPKKIKAVIEKVEPVKSPKNIRASKLKDIADGLIARPVILSLLQQGVITQGDVDKLKNSISGLSNRMEQSTVSFEKGEVKRLDKSIEELEKEFDSLSRDMNTQDFNMLNIAVNDYVVRSLKLLEDEQEEEGRQLDVLEEKEAKRPQFQEQKILPSFSLEQKGDVATSVVAESQQSATAVDDSLKTSTDRTSNTLPRNRRPFFFTLGTDLITKTEEENEEDIETFANFSWIPTDGNFYNGEENTIVRANHANDIIRYDMNNQFGGLWMPEAPQPIFKLTPSIPLYEKMRVSLAPEIQHEQERVPINGRATPGRIKMYSQNVSGMTDEIRRNNIENRDIFPNVVDGIRV